MQRAWIDQLGTAEHDAGTAIAVDGPGNVLVAGNLWPRAWLAKYDPAGKQLWIERFDTFGFAAGLAVDARGNAYVTGKTAGEFEGNTRVGGVSGWDVWLARFEADGDRTWVRQFGTAADWDVSEGVAVDRHGNAYVVGGTWGEFEGNKRVTRHGVSEGWLAKYDPAGEQLWVEQFGNGGDVNGSAVVVGADDVVYVTGDTYDYAGRYDIWLARYDREGKRLSVRQFGSSRSDHPRGIAIDDRDKVSIYITGDTDGAFEGHANAGHTDAWLAKHDSKGDQLWIRQFGTSGYDGARGVAVDSAGNAYVAGYTEGELQDGSAAGGRDAWVAKYDTGGALVWLEQIGTAAADGANGIAVRAEDDVCVVGWTEGDLAGKGHDKGDAWVGRFRAPGKPDGPEKEKKPTARPVPKLGTYVTADGKYQITISRADPSDGHLEGTYVAAKGPTGQIEAPIHGSFFTRDDGDGRSRPFILYISALQRADPYVLDVWVGEYAHDGTMDMTGGRSFVAQDDEQHGHVVSLGRSDFTLQT